MNQELGYLDHTLVRHCWTTEGVYFGYWEDDDLWSYHGRHVGRLSGDDIFAPNGWYLGTLMSCGRLAFNTRIAGMYGASFIACPPRAPISPLASTNAVPSIPSYDSFFRPEHFLKARPSTTGVPLQQ